MAQNARKSGNLEASLKLALRCQSQCARTAEVLGQLKNPMPYVKQANIGQNVQVNNGTSRAGGNQNPPNELLERTDGERLDCGPKGTTSRTDSRMETVVSLNRTTNRKRKG